MLRSASLEHVSDYRATLPEGWPRPVKGPGETGWEQSAYRWLADQAPGAWRDGRLGYSNREHPLMLARDLGYYLDAAVAAMRKAYSRARVELPAYAELGQERNDRGRRDPDLVVRFEPQQVDEVLGFYSVEGPRLLALRRQVQMVEDALSGVRWLPRKANANWAALKPGM